MIRNIVRRYTLLLYPEADGRHSVVVPALPGCATQSNGFDDAVESARDTIRLYLEDLVESGEEVPEQDRAPVVTSVRVPAYFVEAGEAI